MKTYILPGMGAKPSMYPLCWNDLDDPVFIEWPPHEGEKLLPELASRIIEEYKIADGSIVIGSSLGGMIGCEISRLVKLDSLFLIGSAIKKEEVNSFLAIIHEWIDYAPLELIRKLTDRFPGDLANLLAMEDAAFIRYMAKGIFKWEGLGEKQCPLYRIHGKFDLVIPSPGACDLSLIGGHLVAYSHARQCVRFIQEKLDARSQ